MTKITIKLDINGEGKIMLDKKDISKYVVGLNFSSGGEDTPRLDLRLMSENFEIISELHESQIIVDEIKIINPIIEYKHL